MTIPFRKQNPSPPKAAPASAQPLEHPVPWRCRPRYFLALHPWGPWRVEHRTETVHEGSRIVERRTLHRHVRTCTSCGLSQERL